MLRCICVWKMLHNGWKSVWAFYTGSFLHHVSDFLDNMYNYLFYGNLQTIKYGSYVSFERTLWRIVDVELDFNTFFN
jgi:hypothetical protein